MESLEIEVKFYLSDTNVIRSKLLELGAHATGRVFETNIRFENSNGSLIQQKSLLRLRKDSKVTLTFKSDPPCKNHQCKIQKELETEVGNFEIMASILESIGFHKEQTYEKWRETLILNHTTFCMDTMPFGNFLEIEGPVNEIKKWASHIGLKWEKRILLSYLAIYTIIKTKSKLTFSDITFQNFKDVRIDLKGYLHHFEAGR